MSYFASLKSMSHFAALKRYIDEGGEAMQNETIYRWYEQYKVGLFRFALSILKDSHLAEDALQEAFVRLMHQNRLPDSENVQAWLYRVVRNLCYDLLRKQKRETGEVSMTAPATDGN